MKQQVLDWLAEVESGAECSQGLEAVSTAVQQDPAALAALVRQGGLSHVVALQEKESASAAVATILVVASEEYAQELVEANALTVIVGLVDTEANQEDAAWALGNLSAHADIADAMITCGALRTAASPCGPGASGEARRCVGGAPVGLFPLPVRLTTTRVHSSRCMRECADRAADAPLTLLRREHAGTRSPAALRSPPTPVAPPQTRPTSRTRRPTWRLTCAASRRLARWAGSRRCCRCRRTVKEGGGAPSQAALCPSTAAALPPDALFSAPYIAPCNVLYTATAGAAGCRSRRGGTDHALPCQPAAGRRLPKSGRRA